MAKNFQTFERYIFIVERLKKGISMADLCQQFEEEFVEKNQNIGLGTKTFRRDFDALRTFGFGIKYDKKNDKYLFSENEIDVADSKNLEELLYSFQQVAIYSNLTKNKDNSDYLDLERKNLLQYGDFDQILKACKTKNILKFTYYSHWHDKSIDYEVAPYLLKMFRNRWYLIGKIEKTSDKEMLENKFLGDITRFPLERISEIYTTEQKFVVVRNFNPKTFYENSFGIMEPLKNSKIENVELLFEPIQGRYVENLLLHHSQKMLKNKDETLTITLKIHITYDFIQEILHFGETVKVIAPQSLVNVIEGVSEQMNKYYTENESVTRTELY